MVEMVHPQGSRRYNNKDTLFANFRPRGLYQAKRLMTQYNLPSFTCKGFSANED